MWKKFFQTRLPLFSFGAAEQQGLENTGLISYVIAYLGGKSISQRLFLYKIEKQITVTVTIY